MNSIIDLIKKNHQARAIIDRNTTLNYDQLLARVKKTLSLFQKKLREEDLLIAIHFPNNPIEEIISLYALWALNKTVAILPGHTSSEKLSPYLESLPLHFMITQNKKEYLFNKRDSDIETQKDQQKSPHLIIFTSGSSGNPKGALIGLESLLISAMSSCSFYQFQKDEIWGAHLSFHHIGGLMIALRALITKATIEIPEKKSSKGHWPYKNEIDIISLVPTQLLRFIKSHQEENLKKIRAIIVGGASCPQSLKEYCFINKIRISLTYGQTELSSQVSATSILDPRLMEEHYCGHILPHIKIKTDASKALFLKSASLFKGHFIHKKFHKISLTRNHYYKTHDRGKIHSLPQSKKVLLYVYDRSDLIYISGGENISPREIENHLLEHSQIDFALVVPVPSREYGQVSFAFYHSNTHLKEETLKDFLQKKLPLYKIPIFLHPIKKDNHLFDGKINRDHFQKKALMICQSRNERQDFFQQGNPNNPPLLFFHGFMGEQRDASTLFSHLSKDYFCVSMPLPGHYQNYPGNLDKETYFKKIKNIILTFDQIPHIIGYSMGGRLVLELMSHYPHLVSKVILESVHLGLNDDHDKKIRLTHDQNLLKNIKNKNDFRQFLTQWYMAPLFSGLNQTPHFKKLLETKLSNVERLFEYQKAISHYSLGLQAYYYHFLISRTHPILYLSGELDIKYSLIAKSVNQKSPFISSKIIPNASHNIHQMRPEIFSQMVHHFLK